MKARDNKGALAALAFFLVVPACSPQTGAVDGGPVDFSQTSRDLNSCDPLTGNLIGNPGFEDPSSSAPGGNGSATNTGNPKSTIPGGVLGPWDGCCNQSPGGTSFTVDTTMPHCGTRAVTVQSDQASGNVLNQLLDLSSYSGRGFRVNAWAFVSQAQSGAQLLIDVFDLTGNKVVGTSAALTATTADWKLLTVLGMVPTGGNLQVRINSTGTLHAVVDDTSLAIQ
jgi:hypothetical protein